jgi:hypothetical protein
MLPTIKTIMNFSIILTQSTKKAERRIETAEFKFKGDAIKSAKEIGDLFAQMRYEQLVKGAKLSVPFSFANKFKIGIQTEEGIFYASKQIDALGLGVLETFSNYSVRERTYKGEVTTTILEDFKAKTIEMKKELYSALCNAFNVENMIKLSTNEVTKKLAVHTTTKMIGC